MKSILKKSLFSALSLAILALPVSAGNSRTLTQETVGIRYQLTIPSPLTVGEQKLNLKLLRGTQSIDNAKLSAWAMMDDGMKSPIQVSAKAKGEFELKTRFNMGGEWKLKLEQITPVKSEVNFKLTVSDGKHSGHHH